MHSLERSLFIASSCARCDKAISKLRDKQPLDPEEQEWAFNLFNIKAAAQSAIKRAGALGFLLVRENNQTAEKILTFSDKITNKEEMTQEDWQFILDGLIYYRRHLISQSNYCDCGEII